MTKITNPHDRVWELARAADITDQRSCFGIAWFYDEAKADEFAQAVYDADIAKNGGFFDGDRCGREKSFDADGDKGRLYAVTY
jgi:hypothetical protein